MGPYNEPVVTVCRHVENTSIIRMQISLPVCLVDLYVIYDKTNCVLLYQNWNKMGATIYAHMCTILQVCRACSHHTAVYMSPYYVYGNRMMYTLVF